MLCGYRSILNLVRNQQRLFIPSAQTEALLPLSSTFCSFSDPDNFGSLTVPLEHSKKQPVFASENLEDPSSVSSKQVKTTSPSKFYNSRKRYDNALKLSKGGKFEPRHDFHKKGCEPKKQQTIFGDLSRDDPKYKTETKAQREIPEESDCIPSDSFIPFDLKRKRFIDYARDIKQLSREGKIKEAVELFESLSDLGVTYQNKHFLYSVIISACGKRGYTEKAFQIYTKMRQRGLKATPGVLTGLFNACAECPFPEYGLEKAQNLHRKMQEEGWHASQITYHAMIKAYGRCGYLAGAFLLVDEMKRGKFAITDETFSFLLQACISDKEAGFTHAIGVMRKMRTMKIKPTHYNYNLLLRAVRDCGVGPPDISSKLLLEWTDRPLIAKSQEKRLLPPQLKLKSSASKLSEETNDAQLLALNTPVKASHDRDDAQLLALNTPVKASHDQDLSQTKANLQLHEVVFDLLSPSPSNIDILALGEIKTSADRLALIGGAGRIIDKLMNLSEKPTIQTITLLLECQDSSRNAEMALLKYVKEIKLRLDVDFFNVMIKKRCSRWDYSGAREVLELITEHGLYPDIATFGTLAMSCKSRHRSLTLVRDMNKCGFRLNIKVLGALMKNAFIAMDFLWMQELMQQTVIHNVKPCKQFLGQLEKAWKDATHAIVLLEKGKQDVPTWAETDSFHDDYRNFCLIYKKWLKAVEVDLPEHPWSQFRPERKTEFEKKLS